MSLKPQDFAKVMDALPTKVKVIMQQHPREMVLAGGFIRDLLVGDSPSDIDIFVDGGKGAQYAKGLATEFSTMVEKPVEKSDCAFNVRDEYFTQFIHLVPFGADINAPFAVLSSFDFTMAQAALYFDRERGWASQVYDTFYEAIENRRLDYCRPSTPYGGKLSPLSRAFKFVARGWKIDNDQIAEIVAHYTGKTKDVVKEDLDSRYKEKKPKAEEDTLDSIAVDVEAHIPTDGINGNILTFSTPSTDNNWFRDYYVSQGSSSGSWRGTGYSAVLPSNANNDEA